MISSRYEPALLWNTRGKCTHWKREAKTEAKTKHKHCSQDVNPPHLPKIRSYVKDFHLWMEFLPDGTLRQLLNVTDGRPIRYVHYYHVASKRKQQRRQLFLIKYRCCPNYRTRQQATDQSTSGLLQGDTRDWSVIKGQQVIGSFKSLNRPVTHDAVKGSTKGSGFKLFWFIWIRFPAHARNITYLIVTEIRRTDCGRNSAGSEAPY